VAKDVDLNFRLIGKDVSASKVLDGLGKQSEKTGKKFGELGTAFKAVAAGIGVAAVAIGVQAVKSASDLNETMSKSSVVFGENAAAVDKWASTAANAMGQSKQQALEAAATFGNLFVSMDMSKKSAASMSTNLVGLAGDLASFNNVDPTIALEALRSGMVGETEPLRKFGVNLSAVAVQAEAVAKGFVKAEVNTIKLGEARLRLSRAQEKANEVGKDTKATENDRAQAAMVLASAEAKLEEVMKGKVPTLTAAQKAQASYSLILAQTKTAQGDFGRTAGGLANQQRILSAQVADASAKLGQGLLPIVVKLATFATTTLIPAIQTLASWISENVSWLGPLAAGIAAIVIVAQAWSVAQTILNASLFANPIGLIVLGVVALVAAFVAAYKSSETFRKVVDFAFAAVKTVVSGVWNWIKDHWKLLLVVLMGPFGLAIPWIIDHFGAIVDFVKKIPGWVSTAFNGLADFITAPFRAAFAAIKILWNSTLGGFKVHIPGIPGTDVGNYDISIPKLANGGIVSRPTLALIGEQGPEAVVPLSRGGGMGTTIILNVAQAIGPNAGRELLAQIESAISSGSARTNVLATR
jgi:hypothetical protein